MKDVFQIYQNAAVITPSDTAVLSPMPWALLIVGGAGATTLKVDTAGGQIGVNIPLASGAQNIILPLMVTKVYATGTSLGTGGGLMGLW